MQNFSTASFALDQGVTDRQADRLLRQTLDLVRRLAPSDPEGLIADVIDEIDAASKNGQYTEEVIGVAIGRLTAAMGETISEWAASIEDGVLTAIEEVGVEQKLDEVATAARSAGVLIHLRRRKRLGKETRA